MSSRSPRRGSARVAAICSSSSANRRSRCRHQRPGVEVPATSATSAAGSRSITAGVSRDRRERASSRRRRGGANRGTERAAEAEPPPAERVEEELSIRRRSRRRSLASATPSTACRMTSIVTFCAIGRTATRPARLPAIDLARPSAAASARRSRARARRGTAAAAACARQMLSGLEQHHRAPRRSAAGTRRCRGAWSSGSPVSSRRIASRSVVRTSGVHRPRPDRERSGRSARARRR